MTGNWKNKRWIYLPLSIVCFLFALIYLTKVADYLTIPLLSMLLIVVTFLEVYPGKNYTSKANLIKIGCTAFIIALALWYQFTVFIIG